MFLSRDHEGEWASLFNHGDRFYVISENRTRCLSHARRDIASTTAPWKLAEKQIDFTGTYYYLIIVYLM